MTRIEEIKARVSDADAPWACTDDRDDVRWLLSLVEEARAIAIAADGPVHDLCTHHECERRRRARSWLSKVEEAT